MEVITEEILIEKIKAIKASINGTNSSTTNSTNYGQEFENIIASRLEGLTLNSSVDCYEAELTGSEIAKWIHPLHFESNLNSAIDALESIESIKKEELERNLMRIQLNAIEANFDYQDQIDSHFYAKHQRLFEDLDLVGLVENYNVRFTHKFIDLIEYSKAAKLAAERLFDFKKEQLELNDNWSGITRIRESLRELLILNRVTRKKEQEIIIPVSLKRARKINGEWLSDSWQSNTNRNFIASLLVDDITFNLSNYGPIKDLTTGKTRILKIGISVADAHSHTIYVPKAGNHKRLSDLHPTLWGFTLHDGSNEKGYQIGTEQDRVLLDPIQFPDVPGTNNTSQIKWSNYKGVKNFNADRKWKLSLKPNSHNHVSRNHIHDIVVHFHLAYIEK